MMRLNDLLDRCISGQLESEDEETAELVINAIHFRWAYMSLVDEIVAELDLPMPGISSCAD